MRKCSNSPTFAHRRHATGWTGSAQRKLEGIEVRLNTPPDLRDFHDYYEQTVSFKGLRQRIDNATADPRLREPGKSLPVDRISRRCPSRESFSAYTWSVISSIRFSRERVTRCREHSTQLRLPSSSKMKVNFLKRVPGACVSGGHRKKEHSVDDERAGQDDTGVPLVAGQAGSAEANRGAASQSSSVSAGHMNTTAGHSFPEHVLGLHSPSFRYTKPAPDLQKEGPRRPGADAGRTSRRLESGEVREAGKGRGDRRGSICCAQPLVRGRNTGVLTWWDFVSFQSQRKFLESYGGVIEELLQLAVYTVPVESDGEQLTSPLLARFVPHSTRATKLYPPSAWTLHRTSTDGCIHWYIAEVLEEHISVFTKQSCQAEADARTVTSPLRLVSLQRT